MMLSTGNSLFSFFAVSDLHITQRLRGKTAGKRYKAWRFLENEEYSFGLVVGDVTNGCGEEEFAIAKTEFTPLIKRFPLLIGYGNHDYFPNHPGDVAAPESRRQFSDWVTAENKQYGCSLGFFGEIQCFEAWVCGIQVLSLDCAVNYPAAEAGEAQLQWLDEKLTQSDDERFRIVMSHFPLKDYVPGKTGKKQIDYVRDSVKQPRILQKHQNILFFSGHTHFSLLSESPSVLFDESNKVAYCNTASVGNTVSVSKTTGGQQGNISGSMGLQVEVYESGIQVQGIDFLSSSKIEKCCFTLEM